MKKLFFGLLLVFVSNIMIGQNLISNGSFDSLINCPNKETREKNLLLTLYWVSANMSGSPDPYNSCTTEPWYGVPVNRLYSYQQAHSGSGYVGIVNYNSYCDCREYIESPLITALEKNKIYFARFYVSPATDSRRSQVQENFTDGVALNFTDTFMYSEKDIIILNASVDNKGKLIKDTIGWTPVCGAYKAHGGEKYATIGNFRSDAETLVEKEDSYLSSGKYAYLYLDDVSVIKFDPLPDTLILCPNETQKYSAAFLEGTYKWSTGSTDSIINISKSGTYSVEVTIDNCVLTDTVVVIIPPDAQNNLPILRGDTTLCLGKTIELSAKDIPGQYAWSTGSHAATISVNKTNDYAVTVTNRCGTYEDDVNIIFKKCACNVFVPNAFSPNNDGVNDELKVFFGCDFDFKIKRFQIFNRWGSPIFSSNDTNDIHWNGQINGVQLPPDVYVWYLEYEYLHDGQVETEIESGDFTIVR